MRNTNEKKVIGGTRYQKRNGDIFVRFVKPLRLEKKKFRKYQSIVFQVPL